MHSPMSLPVEDAERGEQRRRAVPLVVVGQCPGTSTFASAGPAACGSTLGSDSSRRPDHMIACSGGEQYSPTMSCSFSTNFRSLLSLKERTRCGFSPCTFQIRPTVESLIFTVRAITLRLQCVRPLGFSSSVLWNDLGTWRAAEMAGFLPRPGRSFWFRPLARQRSDSANARLSDPKRRAASQSRRCAGPPPQEAQSLRVPPAEPTLVTTTPTGSASRAPGLSAQPPSQIARPPPYTPEVTINHC